MYSQVGNCENRFEEIKSYHLRISQIMQNSKASIAYDLNFDPPIYILFQFVLFSGNDRFIK